jgi:hypothetical protein
MCGDGNLLQGYIKPCPFSDTISTVTDFPNGTISYNYPYGVNLSIPQVIWDTYSSGTNNQTTISNYFDIQYRRYTTYSDDMFNNGSAYLIGTFRSYESLVSNDAVQPVEGLVVDMINGGIGFRNHTFPPGFQYGATWQEDLLFIEPETVCVDTNLTIDYTFQMDKNNSNGWTDVVLTDRGGFVNLNHRYPEPNLTNPQVNADLWGRAYKAAWLNNAYTALWYNITDAKNDSSGTQSFSYMNSEINSTFIIPTDNSTGSTLTGLDFLVIGGDTYGSYLSDSATGISNYSDPSSATNPFRITSNNFSDISKAPKNPFPENFLTDLDILCTGAGNGDYANITNIFVNCGSMRGVPRRTSPGSQLVCDSGSTWSQPMYVCASAVKATIKTVSFKYNGINDQLSSLSVEQVEDKTYPDTQSMPLWGVENTGNAYYTEDMNLIWGLVSDEYENKPNVSTVRQPSLYLPAWQSDLAASEGMLSESWENLPGSDFSVGALGSAYLVGGSGLSSGPDYSGATNMAMWTRWQSLTNSSITAAKIPNLIYTDYAAAVVVGTKGVLGPGNSAQENLVALTVTPTVSKIKYHYLFAIPALVAALLLVVITLMAFITVCRGGGGMSRMRLHLQQVSPGRIYTTFLYPDPEGMKMRSRGWGETLGRKVVDLSGDFPVAGDMMMPPPEKGARVGV